MRAITYRRYGPPSVLRLQHVDRPVAGDDEALVRIHAASVNSWDWDLVRGKPFFARLGGLRKPKYAILGADIAGTIEEVGANVRRVKPGDQVFADVSGCGWGGFAEFVAVPERVLTVKPPGMTFEQAAAIPQAGLLALQALGYKGQIESGERVLINGAGGGTGTFAVQIAKAAGAEVTGVDSGMKLEMVHSLGADHVFDHTRDDFTRDGRRYDRIIDVVAQRTLLAYRRALNHGGIVAVVGGTASSLLQVGLLGPLSSRLGDKRVGLVVHRPNKGIDVLVDLFERGLVLPVIDRVFPLEEVAEAIQRLGDGRIVGKAVIRVTAQ